MYTAIAWFEYPNQGLFRFIYLNTISLLNNNNPMQLS